MELSDFVDTDRYPVDEPGSPAAGALAGRCRDELAASGLCLLPGFLSASALETTLPSLCAALGDVHRKEIAIVAYEDSDVGTLPAHHTARRAHRHAMSVLARDRIPDESALCRVYESAAMTAFLAQVLEEPVHPLADPLVSLVVTVMGDGDEQGWHFDGNSYVVSILLQKPESGGAFEYVPMVRSGTDAGADRAAAIFDGDRKMVRTAQVEPGTLALFRGHDTVHRVSPVVGTRQRLIALLSYDRRPGTVLSATVQKNNTGRVAQAVVPV